jgi:hypothetical protein
LTHVLEMNLLRRQNVSDNLRRAAKAAGPNFGASDLRCATKLGTWASTIPKSMIDGWKQAAPSSRFFSVQGFSELTASLLTGGCVDGWEQMPDQDGRWVGCVASVAADVRLVNDEGKDVADGESGEQIVRGPVIMNGYYKNDEANRRVCRDGWFHTGDILFRDAAGNYFFADRKKDMDQDRQRERLLPGGRKRPGRPRRRDAVRRVRAAQRALGRGRDGHRHRQARNHGDRGRTDRVLSWPPARLQGAEADPLSQLAADQCGQQDPQAGSQDRVRR